MKNSRTIKTKHKKHSNRPAISQVGVCLLKFRERLRNDQKSSKLRINPSIVYFFSQEHDMKNSINSKLIFKKCQS